MPAILSSTFDSRVRQEAAAERPGEVAEAEVEARRLDALGRDPVRVGADPLLADRAPQLLRGQDARQLRPAPDRHHRGLGTGLVHGNGV